MPCQSCVPGRCSPGLRSVKLRPHKNMLGQVVAPARAWLTAAGDPTEPPDPDMPLLPARRRRPELRDTRGSKRRLVLAADHKRSATSDGFEVTAAKPACLAAGTVLNVAGSDESTELGEIPGPNRAWCCIAVTSSNSRGLLTRSGRHRTAHAGSAA